VDTALKAGGIVDMTAVAAIFAAASLLAAPLPPLPPQGLVVSQVGGLKMVSLSGRALAQVKGLRFATEYALNSGLPRFRDRQGRLWALDRERHRFVPAAAGLPAGRRNVASARDKGHGLARAAEGTRGAAHAHRARAWERLALLF
jgi:hypothetical protein